MSASADITETATPLVAMIVASEQEWAIMRHCADTLARFDVRHECWLLPPAAAPTTVTQVVDGALADGAAVFIVAVSSGAGLAAIVAAHAPRPVLAVPLEAPSFRGLDALTGVVQQAPGLPVASLAIGKAGATNAALLAVAILGTAHPDLRPRLHAFRAEQAAKVLAATLP